MAHQLHGNPYRVLFRSPLLSIHDYVCQRHDPGETEEFEAGFNAIVFPRRGVFLKQVEGAKVVADVNHALFFNRDETFRFSHPCGCGDEVIELALADSALRDITRTFDPARADEGGKLFPFRAVPTDSSTWMLLRLLREALQRTPEPDATEVEEVCLLIAERIIRKGHETHGQHGRRGDSGDPGGRGRRNRGTDRAHVDLVRRTQLTLAGRHDEPWTIEALAGEVASSPYHLCRVFRRRTGLSIHGALNQLRLRTAFHRLLERPMDLTHLALDAGFCSHSHFTSAFRREFGTTPRALRGGDRLEQLRQTSKALTA